jgi:hypothetical protein
VSLQKHSFSELTSPSARYLDEFLKFKQSKNIFEQGVTLNFIDALSSVNDAKINNYSSVYLTTVLPDTKVFDTELIQPMSQNIVTYISILSSTGDLLYLNFTNLNSLSVANSTELAPTYANSYSFSLTGDELNTSSLYFQLELVNENTCRIKHTSEQVDYYLVGGVNTPYSSTFYFLTSQNVDDLPPYYNSSFADGFDYVLDNSGFVYFTKWLYGDHYLVTANNGVLGLTPFTSNTVITENNCLFRIAVTDTSISPKLNTSWVSYKPNEVNNLVINTAKSVTGLKNNNILHFEYENIDDISVVDVNAFKLKNAYTNKFVTKRGNCLVNSSLKTPVPFFREYTTICTGGDQEAGYRDLALNYVFHNYDLRFNPGTRTEFTTPSSLYPYDQINVNDTNFATDGAFGFDIPILSDRITTKNSLNTTDVYGSYLTTWLSGGIWLDRYYFPDIVTRQNALSGNSLYNPTFNNVVSQLAYQNVDKIRTQQYFDVISDLAFYPDETYYYDRVSNDAITSYVNTISNLVQSDFENVTNNNRITNLNKVDSLVLDASNYSSIPIESINSTGSFTVFFTINNNFTNKFSYVMGNLIEEGFGIYNDSAITPVLYIRSDKNLNAYNTDTSLIYSLSFDETISGVVDPAGLGDYHVIAGNSIYNIATDGTIIAKVDVVGLSGYLDYYHAGEHIYFLTPSGLTYIDYNTTSNLYVSGDVTVFASNETSPVGIVYHKGVVYGFESTNLKKDSRNYLYGIYTDDIVLRYLLDEPFEDSVLFARSNTTIKDINVDNEDNVWMLHNAYELTKVDKNRKLLGNMSFLDTLTCYDIDFVNEYKNDGTNYFYPIILAADADNNVYTIKDFDFAVNTNTTTQAVSCVYNGEEQDTTGYNEFVGNFDYNNLNFELKLVNIFNYLDKQSIKFSIPINNLSKFSNTLCFSYSNDGKASLYLNGVLVNSVDVDQYKYIGNIFVRDNIVVGTIPFHNNTILGDFLGIPSYGKLNNTVITDFKLYNRGLNDTEIKALFLNSGATIDSLATSLPCGQRNDIEEIQSMFKLSQPVSKSNVIDVTVKNTGITDVVLQNQLATSIVKEINNTLPGDVSVRDINFINY